MQSTGKSYRAKTVGELKEILDQFPEETPIETSPGSTVIVVVRNCGKEEQFLEF